MDSNIGPSLKQGSDWKMANRLTVIGPDDFYEVTPAAYNESDAEVSIWSGKSLPTKLSGKDADYFHSWQVVVTVNGETYSGVILGTEEQRNGDVYCFDI